jgi:hypothetical protein
VYSHRSTCAAGRNQGDTGSTVGLAEVAVMPGRLVPPRRIEAALGAIADGGVAELENGYPVGVRPTE